MWKGVGLATVIFIAGLVSIPGEYYEAAQVDGASRWDVFRNIMLPLARPATATVITLSLIGGLRSFDLIWAMTKGGPGFASDVIASVIYKQYQAGFYGLSTAGSVVLFLLVTIIVVPLTWWLNRGEATDEEHPWSRRRRQSPSSSRPIFFLVPFVFIFLIASKDMTEANAAGVLLAENFVLFDNLAAGFRRPRLPDGHRLHQQRDPDRGQRRRPGHLQCHGRLHLAAPCQPTRARSINVLVLAGLIVPPAIVPTIWVLQKVGPVQDHARPDLHRDRLRAAVLHPAVPRLPLHGPARAGRSRHRRRGGPVQIFFRVIFPVLRSVVMTVIILQSVFVYNDFQNPLYFLPGTQNATVQVTLLNFQSQFLTQYNLLFATILLVMIPPLIMFIFFNRKIVEGMAAGSVKG